MKFISRLFITLLLVVGTLSAVAYFFWYKPAFKPPGNTKPFICKNTSGNAVTLQRLRMKACIIKRYVAFHHYNTDYCFMADMQIHSGKKRFFVYNLDKDSVECAGLVAHGSGRNALSHEIEFSNTTGSLCTSLGKYAIGNAYHGKFGLAFKLYGLDTTNSNALNRCVVLHAHPCVPAEETAPFPICQSWGCPTVSPVFLSQLKRYIDKANKPVLLEIYY